MFVISVKSKHLKSIFAIAVAFILTVIGGVVYVSESSSTPVSKINSYSLKAITEEDRQSFFAGAGFTVNPVPLEVREIIIPEEFDKVYNEYNELQKAQGFDLTEYKGLRVKSWSYEITNYPGFENSNGQIRGNILTYKGEVIACDISNIELNGFMEKLL